MKALKNSEIPEGQILQIIYIKKIMINMMYYYDKDNDKIQDYMFTGYLKALIHLLLNVIGVIVKKDKQTNTDTLYITHI